MMATVSTLLATFIVLILDTPYGLKARVYYTLKMTFNTTDFDMDTVLKALKAQKKVKVKPIGFEMINGQEQVIVQMALSAKSDDQHLSIQKTIIEKFPNALHIKFHR